jgi:hypothetical protein
MAEIWQNPFNPAGLSLDKMFGQPPMTPDVSAGDIYKSISGGGLKQPELRTEALEGAAEGMSEGTKKMIGAGILGLAELGGSLGGALSQSAIAESKAKQKAKEQEGKATQQAIGQAGLSTQGALAQLINAYRGSLRG